MIRPCQVACFFLVISGVWCLGFYSLCKACLYKYSICEFVAHGQIHPLKFHSLEAVSFGSNIHKQKRSLCACFLFLLLR